MQAAISGMPFGQLDASSPAAVRHRADLAAGDQYHRRGIPCLPSSGYERPSSPSPVTPSQGRDRCDAHRYRYGQCPNRRPAKRDFVTWGARRRLLEVAPHPRVAPGLFSTFGSGMPGPGAWVKFARATPVARDPTTTTWVFFAPQKPIRLIWVKSPRHPLRARTGSGVGNLGSQRPRWELRY